MDPITTGLAVKAGQLATTHGKDKFVDMFYSEVGAFFKRLKKELAGDSNVPLDQIEGARVDPTFVGIAQSLIDGNPGAREALRDYLDSGRFDPAADSYESPKAVRTRIFDAALRAAIEAPRSERQAQLASERRIEETVRDQTDDLRRQVENLARAQAAQTPQPTEVTIDEDKLARIIAREFQRRNETEVLEEREQLAQKEDEQEAATSVPAAEQTAKEQSAAPQEDRHGSGISSELGLGPNEVRVLGELFDKLEGEYRDAVAEVRKVLEQEGLSGVTQSLRGDLGAKPPEILDLEARIAGFHGDHKEAEAAHLQAAGKYEDPQHRARQFVRAASMAQGMGEIDRARGHLAKAEDLVPGHPGVAILEARISDDQQFALSRLAEVDPETDRERAVLHVTRAQAQMALDDFDLARVEIEAAQQLDPNHLMVREVAAMLPWAQARAELQEGREPDRQALLVAAEGFERIGSDLAPTRRKAESGHLFARAVESFAIAGEVERAASVLEKAVRLEPMDPEVGAALGNSAMLAGRVDLALRFTAGAEDNELSKLVRADAVLHQSAGAELEAAIGVLEKFLESEDSEVRDQAAYSLLSGAVSNDEVAWNETAEKLVAARNAIIAKILRAEVHAREGEFDKAEGLLLPLSSDSRAQRALRSYAEAQGQWGKVRDRTKTILALTGRPSERLRLADATAKSGSSEKAREEYLAIARDQQLDPQLRGAAFGGVVEIASNGGDYEQIRTLSEEWHRQLPEDSNGLWNLLFALARLARHHEAYELSSKANPDANTPERASLYAEILSRAAPGQTALRRIAALSDRFEREIEALEGIFLMTALRVEQEDPTQITEDLGERIRDTWETFPQRFPDQQFMQAVKAPSNIEEFERLLRDMGGDTAKHQHQIQHEILDGQQSVNTLAAVTPHGRIGRSWSGLSKLPLGFSDPDLDRGEREAALEAIGGSVVWDSSSLFISGGLGQKHVQLLRGVFPDSKIAVETLEDADQALATVPGPGHQETVQHPETGAFLGVRESTEPERRRLSEIAKTMLEMAREFEAAPGPDQGTDPELKEAYDKSTGKLAWNAMISSMALAQRLDVPLFSDDRWIRQMARTLGIPTFGTVALLDALGERGVIGEEERATHRRDLLASGAWGISPTGGEIVAFGEQSSWALDAALIGALNDRAAWRADPASYIHQVLAFLEGVFQNDPDRLKLWTHRVIAAIIAAIPTLSGPKAGEVLLTLAWDINGSSEVSGACFRAILETVGRLPLFLGNLDSRPVEAAFLEILALFGDQPPQLRWLMFLRMIRSLPPHMALAAIDRFVEKN